MHPDLPPLAAPEYPRAALRAPGPLRLALWLVPPLPWGEIVVVAAILAVVWAG